MGKTAKEREQASGDEAYRPLIQVMDLLGLVDIGKHHCKRCDQEKQRLGTGEKPSGRGK